MSALQRERRIRSGRRHISFKPALIILGGLPGAGKTTAARVLASRLGAVHLRIDTIEAGLRGKLAGPTDDTGYRIAYALAGDNLKLGLTVIADSVNPILLTREAWRDVARRAGARSLEVELVCSDERLHRRRVETRRADIDGQKLPTWQDVLDREYEPWPERELVIDANVISAADAAAMIAKVLGRSG